MPKYTLDKHIKSIICDIEGTTTSISFVKDVLFPYSRKNVKKYFEENFENELGKDDIKLLIEQSKIDSETNEDFPKINENIIEKQELIDQLEKNVIWQIDYDRKTKALKQLQGNIWKKAYENGEVTGHVYDDVKPAFERWLKHDKNIYIYSSGSVPAQILLFSNSDYGNMTKYLKAYFDTNIGPKIDSNSYTKILEKIGHGGDEVVFLTDIIKEGEAAVEAGLNVYIVRRKDNPDNKIADFKWIESFDELF